MKTERTSPPSHPGGDISPDEIVLNNPALTSRFIDILREILREITQSGEPVEHDAIFNCHVQDNGQLCISYSLHSSSMMLRVPASDWSHANKVKPGTNIGSLVWAMSLTLG